MKQEKEILQKAIDKWGQRAQLEMMQEEATELALAVRKFIRKNDNQTFINMAEEIADVEILISQIRYMFNYIDKHINDAKKFKLERLEDRINKNNFES